MPNEKAIPAEPRIRIWRNYIWPLVAGALLALAAIAIYGLATHLKPALRARVIEKIRERYQSEVELGDFDLSLFPRIVATGHGLTLRLHGRRDVPPMVTVEKFSIETGFGDVMSGPKHVSRLQLYGLRITVAHGEAGQAAPTSPPGAESSVPTFVIDRVDADGATLEILPRQAGKEPLLFELYKLQLHSAGLGQPMTYSAQLRNAKPPGLIDTSGQFGPWQADDPIRTPVSGSYHFENADLSVFRGISGTLASDGKFTGYLDHIEAQGTTDTPNFALGISGHPVDLKTEFHSIVDGGNGDTQLQPVTSHFLGTTIVSRGGAIGTPGVKGKRILLNLTIAGGRIEDLLRLALKSSTPLMTGRVNLRTKFDLPQGEQDVMRKLKLNGTFELANGKFNSASLQEKLNTLSERAQGHPRLANAGDAEEVMSNLQGTFILDNTVMTFSKLSFGIPGALIRLTGTYGLSDETMDLHGDVRVQARLSQMTTGFKSILLKAVDPFFKKDGAGAVIPIKITGTRAHPAFGLELRRKK